MVIGSRKARPLCVACGGSVWSKGYRSVVLVDLPAFGRPVRLGWRKTAVDVSEHRLCAQVVHRTRPHDWSPTGVVDIPSGEVGDHRGRSTRSPQNLVVGGIR